MMQDQPTQDVFDGALLRPATDGSGLAQLTWRAAGQGDRVVQVYIDGRLYDATAEPTDRAMWLQLDPTRGHAVELLAVPSEQRWADHREALGGGSSAFTLTAAVAMNRDESWPIDSRVTVHVDGELVHDRPLWASTDHRGGFGGLFGEGPFGRDPATAPGSGLGEFGFGAFGFGGAAWRWRGRLTSGEHTIETRIDGQVVETQLVNVDAIGEPVTVSVTHEGEQTVLSW